MSIFQELAEIVLHDFKSMTPHKTGYDATKSLYQIKPSIYTKFRGGSKTHTWRGGAKCVICLDRKPALTTRWCRGCDTAICAGCYKTLRASGLANSSGKPSVPIIYDKQDQHWRDSKSVQPKCPTCREVGLFAPQGIRATRVIKIDDYYHGPNISVDTKLHKYMEEYVDEYNKIFTTIFDMNEERVEEDKANWKKFYDSLVIKDINKTIDDKKKEIKKLQDDIIKLENDKEEWKSINFTKKAKPVNTKTLDDIGIKFTDDWVGGQGARRYVYYDEADYELSVNDILRPLSRYPTSMTMETIHNKYVGDFKLARHCEFSQFGGASWGWTEGGRLHTGLYIFTKLNEKHLQITKRFDELICGLALPTPPISVQAVSMTDDEIEAKMAEMMAIMEARKKNKN